MGCDVSFRLPKFCEKHINFGMKFAVVIPLYNRARFIAEALDAILSQSHPPAEIIVVDDGSIDGGPEIVERYAGRVTLLRFPQNRGQQAARNAAISEAKSEWIAFCDSDDLWRPDHLLLHSRMLNAYPDVRFGFSDFAVEQDGRIIIPSKFDMAPAGYWEDADRRIVSQGWLFAGISHLPRSAGTQYSHLQQLSRVS
jgi:glycosyltransferase involved in cell wall biosynthesis